jgi:protein SCO1
MKFALAISLAMLLSGCARRYLVDGMVLSVDPPQRRLVVSHSRIDDFMPAMTMPFTVRNPAELRDLHRGSRIRFRLNVGRGRSWISRIEPLPASVAELSRELAGAPIKPPAEAVAIGQKIPAFALTDQSGEAASPEQWRGRVAVVNFIYTRCPLPEVCPRLTASFASLQRRFAGRLGRDLILVSITLDPQHDTPEVLSRYAESVGARPGAWLFLTGTLDDVKRVAGYFGLVHWAEEGVIVHTSATVLLARDSRLAGRIEGSSFPLSQLVDLVAHQLED